MTSENTNTQPFSRLRAPRRIVADDTEGHVRTYPQLVDDQQPGVRPPRAVDGNGRTYPDEQPG